MAISDYSTVRTSLFVKITVDEYWDETAGDFVAQTLAFSDHFAEYTFDSTTYTALGTLVSIGSTQNVLFETSNAASITISGLPDTSLLELAKSRLKASPVEIHRGYFTHSGQLIVDPVLDNPIGRFRGFVENYSILEEWDAFARTSSNTLQFECSSSLEVLANKTSGRKTNPASMKRFYPTDVSFDRMPALVGSDYNFGRKL